MQAIQGSSEVLQGGDLANERVSIRKSISRAEDQFRIDDRAPLAANANYLSHVFIMFIDRVYRVTLSVFYGVPR